MVDINESESSFWSKIIERFINEMNQCHYRTKYQIYTNWRNVNKVVKSLTPCLIKRNTIGQNGENDAMVLNTTFGIFHQESFPLRKLLENSHGMG